MPATHQFQFSQYVITTDNRVAVARATIPAICNVVSQPEHGSGGGNCALKCLTIATLVTLAILCRQGTLIIISDLFEHCRVLRNSMAASNTAASI